MKLTGFEFITGKLVPRPWGTEYRFTAAGAGTEYNEVLDVKKDIDEKALAVLVQERLDRVSVPVPEPVVETVTVEQVEKYLKDNAYLTEEQTLDDIKTTDEVAKEAK